MTDNGLSLLFYSAFGIITAFALFYLWMKHKHSYWKKRGVRSPPTHWLFGNLKDAILFRKPTSYVFADLYNQGTDSDDVLGIYIMHKPFLLIRSPELIKQILVKDFHFFPNRYFAAKTNDHTTSINLFSIENPTWKHLRVKLTPIFSSGKIKKLFYLMIDSAEALKNYFREQFDDGAQVKTLKMKEASLKYTTNIISTLAFGVQTNSFDPAMSEFYKKSQDPNQGTILTALKMFLVFFFPNISKFFTLELIGKYTSYFANVFWNSFHEREKSGNKRGDLIDSLIKLKGEESEVPELKFEGNMLFAQAAVFFSAGRETSTTVITFALVELAKNPELQDRVRAEIVKILKAEGFTYEAVYKMKHLNHVASETLRLYPAAPILDRVPVQDYKIPGTDIVIEKGTPVYVILTGLHVDPRFHRNPEVFDPDRFSDERKDEMIPYTYMPFGEGPRECIAMRLGFLQSLMGLITILSNYEVSLDPMCKYEVDIMNVFITPPSNLTLNFKKLVTAV